MVSLFQCQLCNSKILENNVQKHHAKVHSGVDHDIYTPLTTSNAAPSVASNMDTQASADQLKNVAPVADGKSIHVACTICGNRMPAESVDQHMKRKHNDGDGDQVDAVGTKVNAMSFDVFEKCETTAVVNRQAYPVAEMTTSGSKPKNPFSKSFQFTATPKTDASTTTDGDLPAFYTIRVSVDQMKQLMSQNRIDPKGGYFYLK